MRPAGVLPLPGMPPDPGRRCDVCGGALALAPFYGDAPVTYVMRRDRWVKIGKSKHPETRLKELRAIGRQKYIICPAEMDRTLPIEIVRLLPGDLEHELHERFAEHHAAGEWFLELADVADWLAS